MWPLEEASFSSAWRTLFQHGKRQKPSVNSHVRDLGSGSSNPVKPWLTPWLQHHEWSWAMLLNRFSRVQLCATPWMAAHQGPPVLGFSRQEHWSGLPVPTPMHESEKWKWSRSVVSDSSWPHGPQPSRLLRPWDFPGNSTEVGCHCLLRVLSHKT